jgi:hypothetical protein
LDNLIYSAAAETTITCFHNNFGPNFKDTQQ